ncbi:MAG: hypothetical protein WAK18_00340 [Nocardioidaceae bacterium]
MMLAYQLMGAVAIVVSLVGTWLAATNRSGWLVCVASSAMWFPALVSGNQWAAVANCWLSIGICLRNFKAQSSSLGTRPVQSYPGIADSEADVGRVLDRPMALANR